MYVCVCNAVTERDLKECFEDGADTLEKLACETGLGMCCGRCKDLAADMLDDLHCQNAQSTCCRAVTTTSPEESISA